MSNVMVNMFVPGTLDALVKERAEKIRMEQRKAGVEEYVPEWVALVSLLEPEVLTEFDERHDETLSTIELIAEDTGEEIRIDNPGEE